MDPEMRPEALGRHREPLSASQAEAALQYLEEKLVLLPTERDDWADVLPYLFPGELRPVVERWRGRPSPEAVLDYIRTQRVEPE